MYLSTDLFNQNGCDIKSMNRCFRRLAAKFHPDLRSETKGEEDLILKFITNNWNVIKGDQNQPLVEIPIYIRKIGTQTGGEVPVLINTANNNIREKAKKYLQANIRLEKTDFLKPFCVLTVEDYPVKPFIGCVTNILHLRKTVLPIIKNLNDNLLLALLQNFLGSGKRYFRDLQGTGLSDVFIFFNCSDILVIKSGKNIEPVDLTFARFCALLGEINRNRFYPQNRAILPSFSKNIIIIGNKPETFKYFLHHGVQFSWSFTDDKTNNRQIYFAIKSMDMSIINMKRKRCGFNIYKTVQDMDDSSEIKTFRQDLIKYIGLKTLTDFESENAVFIEKWAKKIWYNNY